MDEHYKVRNESFYHLYTNKKPPVVLLKTMLNEVLLT